MDVFDGVPDPIIIDILNKVGDVKTLLRCTSLSKRFNSLVPQSDSLFLRLDHQAFNTDSDSHSDSPVNNIFQSFLKSFQNLFSVFTKPNPTTTNLSPVIPAKILSRFERIQELEIELPGADAKVQKGSFVKWKAEFGKTLKSCVIVAFRSANTVSSAAVDNGESDAEFVTGLKTRVVWTISALMSASTRHHMMSRVVKEHGEIKSLVVRDKQGEGTVVMGAEGLKEFRNTVARGDDEEEEMKKKRSVVPSVKMSMRHAPMLKLKSGICLESATLVVVRPSGVDSGVGDDELATEAFAGECMYGEAVVALLKCKKSSLEMNEF